jgi:hypothetical protein
MVKTAFYPVAGLESAALLSLALGSLEADPLSPVDELPDEAFPPSERVSVM